MKKLILIVALVSFSFSAFTQKAYQKAEASFNNREYVVAIKLYNKAISEAKDNTEVRAIYFKIAEAYRLMNDYIEAITWYEDAMDNGYKDINLYLVYSDVLARSGNLDEAIAALKKYMEQKSGDPVAVNKLLSCEYAKENLKSVNTYNPVKLEPVINTEFSEYGIGWFDDYLMFSSNKMDAKAKTDSRTGEGYSDVYQAAYDKTKRLLEAPEKVVGSLNTDYNDGTFFYDARQSLMYIMQSNGYQGKGNINTSKFENGKWSKCVSLNLNSKTYSIGHPTMAKEGKTLYFVSDMPGGKGGKDIWKSTRGSDGIWGTPKNLGDGVNTAADELFPFVLGDSMLFFASEGHTGFGGLDIFCARADLDGNFVNPVNLGYPFNTASDDFNMIIRDDTRGGFMCSNRPKGIGMDDVYSFPNFPAVISASGYITDFKTGNPVPNAKIVLVSSKGYIDSLSTDESGKYKFNGLLPSQNYSLTISAPNYFDDIKTFVTTGNDFFKGYSKETGTDIDFTLISQPQNWFTFKGNVSERSSMIEMPNERISVISKIGSFQDLVVTDSIGNYITSFVLPSSYGIKIMKAGYWSESRICDGTDAAKGDIYCKETGHDMDFELTKVEPKKEIILSNILYDFAKASLRPESKEELDKVVSMLNETPNIKIEISSHTDARGDAKTNLKLSLARAKSVVDYLISMGISSKRLVAKGYGKTKLLIPNAFTEEDHQKNRRTSFTVLQVTTAKNVETEGYTKLEFMLQVLVSENPINVDKYFEKLSRHLPYVKIQKKEEKIDNKKQWVYFAGIYAEKDLDKVALLKEKLKNMGYTSCILVPLKDGKRIGVSEALELLSR